MMETYEEAKMEVIRFETEDIITVSDPKPGEDEGEIVP